ncbi:hypothetical protein [Rhodanobacter denitrificans]|uniref:Uncharacterized protein n=1 Tax=Rhodanobacter denitrificans TaxID=666685 RepID=M4NG23_9GAMM|nr:hypothetical protein [Rhodanobacter denitrificans]AGG89900.1 hypothetical protein R2APBS1_2823 [Rhodanobacter denitrificans]UJM85296.1 hypothetical protein LRJ86_10950 [Rhodanobacter denitrificans]
MTRPRGRPPLARQRAMRFALWARAQPSVPTPVQIADFLAITLPEARTWRAAWLEVISPTAGAAHVAHR